jgi:hypothetical protein
MDALMPLSDFTTRLRELARADPQIADGPRLSRLVSELADAYAQARREARGRSVALPPIDGDMLPPIGAVVQIHLASADAWVDHTVVGYYVWPPVANSGVRVHVRVADAEGYLNARLLTEVQWNAKEPRFNEGATSIAKAYEHADARMLEALQNLGSPIEDGIYALTSERLEEVSSLDEASSALREAVQWLRERDLAEISDDAHGVVVRVPQLVTETAAPLSRPRA